ncbi:tudor domain-containing protein [Gamsiella multidivaricata]|uniref:tudor domain-containing protein n=1 Tax=Gamsiella multidivaricata TaxID=101098 RepID=UPI00221EE86E|nr:tudor domain-containing protein [Gamsiella multidivaricata]KAI7820061.1 tudor domain-containing protein [Gamsiella multidivaricata]
MSSGKATVKSVLSADMVVLSGRPRAGGPPATRTLGLNYIQAPKLGNKDRSDEPFAFAARNYLRKLLVGKEVMFRVDYTVPSTGREYGALFLNQENVAHMLVREGWADVREIRASDAENVDVEALYSYKAEAQAAKRGIWAENESGVRKAHYNLEGDAEEFVEKYKGKQLPAIIESIRDGSTVRACLTLPNGEYQYITLMISGIRAPIIRQGLANTDDLVEPFAEEAKFFVESRLLQREVRVVLELVGQNGNNIFGSILHPAGNIAEALVANGLAKVADWSITHVTGGPTVLREAERKAQASKLRLWQDHVVKSKGQDHEFDSTVVRIMTGDTIIVRNSKGQERKIRLSNIKAPTRLPQQKGVEIASYDYEAKEFLRKRLIGKNVHVTIDYVKPPSDQFPEPTECATVKVGEINVGEQLVLKGLADVIKSRDDRSQFYDQLLVAEAKAKEEGKGKHSAKEPPKYKWSDASENAAKAKQFLPFFQRGRTQAIVEYVANGSRFKLIIPKENCKMTFVLGGIRCPRAARNPGEKAEAFGAEALDFVSRRCQQREVEIEVESLDKTGGFVGTMWLNKTENVAALLLEEGLASIHSYSADQSKQSSALYAAERAAKQERKNLWTNVDPNAAVEEEEVDTAKPIKKEYLDVVVSEIVSGGHFYVQVINQQTESLEKMMSELGIHHKNASTAPPNWKPRLHEIVSAKFTEDNQWYRAKVVRNVAESKSVEVIYVDYGNSETIPLSRVCPLPTQFSSLPQQAHESFLSYVKVPELKDDYGIEAANRFRDLVSGRQLVGVVDQREHNVMHLTLYDPAVSEDPDRSLNSEMVRDGLATVFVKTRYARHPSNQSLVTKLQEATALAKRERLNLFEYGDNTADDEDSRY